MALNLTVKIHPVILFQVIDAYERRNADAHRVIGTLLGTVDKGVVEVSNCFCVPHKEYAEKVEADLKFASDMWELNRRVSPQETIVGWWATGDEVTSHSALIHDYYARECNNPVHLTVDTTLQSGSLGIKAYVCVPIGVPRGTTGSMFTPVPVDTIQTQPEVVGVRLCQKSKKNVNREAELSSELGQISEASSNMESMLETVLAYVEDVLAGKIPADNSVGRELLGMIHSVPKMSPQHFDEMINSNVKDLLMVIYLSQLTRTQLQLNEKLTLLSTN